MLRCSPKWRQAASTVQRCPWPTAFSQSLFQKLLELLGLIDLHHAEFLLLTVLGLLASLRLTQDADLMFYGLTFAFHCMRPFY